MDWLHFLTLGRGAPLALYAAFQVAAILCLRGRFRIAALAPLLLLALIGANMLLASPRGRGVWLMILLVVAPGAVLAIALVWAAEVLHSRRGTSAALLAVLCALAILAAVGGQPGYASLWHSGWAIAWTAATAFTLVGFGLVTSQLRR
jgi:hypothetical protein